MTTTHAKYFWSIKEVENGLTYFQMIYHILTKMVKVTSIGLHLPRIHQYLFDIFIKDQKCIIKDTI